MVDPRVTTLQRHFTSNLLYFISEGRRPLRNVGNDVTAGTDQRHFGCGSAVRLTGQGHSIGDIQCQFSRLHRVQGEWQHGGGVCNGSTSRSSNSYFRFFFFFFKWFFTSTETIRTVRDEESQDVHFFHTAPELCCIFNHAERVSYEQRTAD